MNIGHISDPGLIVADFKAFLHVHFTHIRNFAANLVSLSVEEKHKGTEFEF